MANLLGCIGMAHLRDDGGRSEHGGEELGQDVLSTDQHEVMKGTHIGNDDHRCLAFLRNSRPASNSSTEMSCPAPCSLMSLSASWKLMSRASRSWAWEIRSWR